MPSHVHGQRGAKRQQRQSIADGTDGCPKNPTVHRRAGVGVALGVQQRPIGRHEAPGAAAAGNGVGGMVGVPRDAPAAHPARDAEHDRQARQAEGDPDGGRAEPDEEELGEGARRHEARKILVVHDGVVDAALTRVDQFGTVLDKLEDIRGGVLLPRGAVHVITLWWIAAAPANGVGKVLAARGVLLDTVRALTRSPTALLAIRLLPMAHVVVRVIEPQEGPSGAPLREIAAIRVACVVAHRRHAGVVGRGGQAGPLAEARQAQAARGRHPAAGRAGDGCAILSPAVVIGLARHPILPGVLALVHPAPFVLDAGVLVADPSGDDVLATADA
mmetsp:Transcript_37729/g.95533  ORF Transcript_37729/g.95533 Transcript_37729/m.95533 type:complete len:331 (-) Transcript_37729:273-1265(-)